MTNAGDGAPFNPEPTTPEQPHQPEWPGPAPQVAYVGDGTPYNPEPTTQQWPVSAPPAKSKKTGVIVLAIVAVLFLGAAGAFGALYFSEKSDHDAVSAQLVDKNKQLAAKDMALSDSKQQVEDAKDAKTEAESKNTALNACHDAATALRTAAINNEDEAKATTLVGQLFLACP